MNCDKKPCGHSPCEKSPSDKTGQNSTTPCELKSGLDRRTMLLLGGAGALGLCVAPWLRNLWKPSASVFIAKNQSYQGELARTIEDGLFASGLTPNGLRGKRVLLKPNLVEPFQERAHMTTHPAMVVAAAEVFQKWGARVTVGEAPGHVRDTEMALWASGMGEALKHSQIRFADLNYEAVRWVPNKGRTSTLKGFFLPKSIVEADLLVSMPKMKTHHWMGMTCGMKNLYGVLPGIQYGWPKNVLHHHGIPQTVYDINASVPQTVTIVDGIDCMEGDGPILGSLKKMGLVVVGTNLPAVDATVCRIMGLNPRKIPYLALAENNLGPLAEHRIEQRGEQWQPLVSPFAVLDRPHLRKLRATSNGPLVS